MPDPRDRPLTDSERNILHREHAFADTKDMIADLRRCGVPDKQIKLGILAAIAAQLS